MGFSTVHVDNNPPDALPRSKVSFPLAAVGSDVHTMEEKVWEVIIPPP